MNMQRRVHRVCVMAAAAMLLGVSAPSFAQDDDLHAKIEAALAKMRPVTLLYGQESSANMLLQMAPSLHTARPEFVAALDEKNMVIRWTAAKVLGTIGPEAKEAVPALAKALPTSEWYTQVMMAWALSRMGSAATPAVPALVEVLGKSKDVWVKREVAVALGAIGPDARDALPLLESALQDKNGFVRVAAAAALYQVGRDARGVPLLIDALKDPYIVGPRVAADALAAMGEGAKPAVPALTVALQDPASSARVAAARALWLADQNTEGVPVLVAALCDEYPEVRQRASETLRLIGTATPQTFPEPSAPAEKKQAGTEPLDAVRGWASERVCERLDRGLTAVRTQDGVSLSWRLLADDSPDVAFDVYRAEGAGPGLRLNAVPVTRTTDFLDRTAPNGATCRYWVTLAGTERDRVSSVPVPAPASELPYLPIKLQGDYRALNLGIGDLDGDGRMDYVIKQPETLFWSFRYTWYRSPDTYKLEAYNADGKFLWRQSMGWGVELCIRFSPFLVYDLDGDGRAEVVHKGADADPRDADGRCDQGAEYVTVLDGQTGEVRCRAEWPSRDGFDPWEGAPNQLAVAYLDGKTPCVIAERGTYGLQKAAAYQLKGNQLECLWRWDNRKSERAFRGQGAHTLHAADVDGDGRDEVILGCSVLDDNGVPLWATGLGHCDVCCVGDFDPANTGLEIFYTQENPQKQNGVSMVDGRTGKVLWGRNEGTVHVGWGLASDVDATHPGCEAWAAEDAKTGAFTGAPPRWLFSAQGELLAQGQDIPGTTSVVYWDGDPQRELIQGGRARDYQGGAHPPAIEGSVLAVVDVTGDWREEIITSLPGELRIYSTAVPAGDRQTCLLQDPTYRLAVTNIASMYYSQPMLGRTLASARSSMLVSGPSNGLSPTAANACNAVVIAADQAALAGTLQLSAGPDVVLEPASIPVSVAAGQSVKLPFSVRLGHAPSPLDGRVLVSVTATLRPGAGDAVEAQASLPVADAPMAGVPLTGAGDFVEQSGGEARLRTDKPESAGRALSHWNDKGHRIAWQIQVPQAGRYHLAIRYANSWGWVAERSLWVDGKALPGAERVGFPPVGTVLDEWATLPVRLQDGTLAVWELDAGPHRIAMDNTNDRWLNLDQLAFVPAP